MDEIKSKYCSHHKPNKNQSQLLPNHENHFSIQALSDYKILQTIGRGTFSKVKLGIHNPTNEKVAIKILDKNKMVDKDDYDRVKREIEITTQLNHRNVVRIHEMKESSNCFYIIMDYCERGELFNYIVKKRRLNDDESAFFYYQLINGLEYIHSLGVVHRDLKPENLLLSKNKELKIIDFGLSNYFKGTNSANKYNHDFLLSTPCGSPCYASPEMVAGKKYNGFRIDIWSTGIILYAMLCGYLPFEDKDNNVLFKTILECNVDYPNCLSSASRDLMKRILVTNPDKRITICEIKKHSFYLKGERIYNAHFGINILSINNNKINDMIYGYNTKYEVLKTAENTTNRASSQRPKENNLINHLLDKNNETPCLNINLINSKEITSDKNNIFIYEPLQTEEPNFKPPRIKTSSNKQEKINNYFKLNTATNTASKNKKSNEKQLNKTIDIENKIKNHSGMIDKNNSANLKSLKKKTENDLDKSLENKIMISNCKEKKINLDYLNKKSNNSNKPNLTIDSDHEIKNYQIKSNESIYSNYSNNLNKVKSQDKINKKIKSITNLNINNNNFYTIETMNNIINQNSNKNITITQFHAKNKSPQTITSSNILEQKIMKSYISNDSVIYSNNSKNSKIINKNMTNRSKILKNNIGLGLCNSNLISTYQSTINKKTNMSNSFNNNAGGNANKNLIIGTKSCSIVSGSGSQNKNKNKQNNLSYIMTLNSIRNNNQKELLNSHANYRRKSNGNYSCNNHKRNSNNTSVFHPINFHYISCHSNKSLSPPYNKGIKKNNTNINNGIMIKNAIINLNMFDSKIITSQNTINYNYLNKIGKKKHIPVDKNNKRSSNKLQNRSSYKYTQTCTNLNSNNNQHITLISHFMHNSFSKKPNNGTVSKNKNNKKGNIINKTEHPGNINNQHNNLILKTEDNSHMEKNYRKETSNINKKNNIYIRIPAGKICPKNSNKKIDSGGYVKSFLDNYKPFILNTEVILDNDKKVPKFQNYNVGQQINYKKISLNNCSISKYPKKPIRSTERKLDINVNNMKSFAKKLYINDYILKK